MNDVICKNCGNFFKGKYCNACGEKVYNEHDRNLAHFIEEGIHFITHLEGKLLKTLKTIFLSPFLYSSEYCDGIRKKYFKPLSLFLLLVVIYLIFPLFDGLNMPVQFYKTHNWFGDFATQKIEYVLTSKHLTMDQLDENFNAISAKYSKLLLLIIIPFSALVLWGFTFLKRKYLFDQLVLASEFNALFILWGYLIFPLLIFLGIMIINIFGANVRVNDNFILVVFIYLIPFIYFFRGSMRFYNLAWGKALFLTLFFLIAHYLIVQLIYKFILFNLVINKVH